MGMFKAVVAEQLKLLLILLLLGTGNPFRVAPSNPAAANTCGEDLHLRVFLARYFLPVTVFAAFAVLLTVRTHLRAAEAAGADREGIGSVAPRRRRLRLRGSLLLAVAFSFAASLLAVVAFEGGFRYRTGCRAAGYGGYGAAGSPRGVLLIAVFALVHGFFAWAAVTQN